MSLKWGLFRGTREETSTPEAIKSWLKAHDARMIALIEGWAGENKKVTENDMYSNEEIEFMRNTMGSSQTFNQLNHERNAYNLALSDLLRFLKQK